MSFVLGCRLKASPWTLLHEVEGFLEPEILAWDATQLSMKHDLAISENMKLGGNRWQN